MTSYFYGRLRTLFITASSNIGGRHFLGNEACGSIKSTRRRLTQHSHAASAEQFTSSTYAALATMICLEYVIKPWRTKIMVQQLLDGERFLKEMKRGNEVAGWPIFVSLFHSLCEWCREALLRVVKKQLCPVPHPWALASSCKKEKDSEERIVVRNSQNRTHQLKTNQNKYSNIAASTPVKASRWENDQRSVRMTVA